MNRTPPVPISLDSSILEIKSPEDFEFFKSRKGHNFRALMYLSQEARDLRQAAYDFAIATLLNHDIDFDEEDGLTIRFDVNANDQCSVYEDDKKYGVPKSIVSFVEETYRWSRLAGLQKRDDPELLINYQGSDMFYAHRKTMIVPICGEGPVIKLPRQVWWERLFPRTITTPESVAIVFDKTVSHRSPIYSAQQLKAYPRVTISI